VLHVQVVTEVIYTNLYGDRMKGILVSTPRINSLSDWSLRRGAPQIFLTLGAPRLSDQSDRLFILGVETSTVLGKKFQESPQRRSRGRPYIRAMGKP
jgi:hypothetical protein